MRELKTEIIINSTPEKVWAVLTDFGGFPNWNPFIKNISGEQQVGSKLEVSRQPPDAKGMTFKPTVLKVAENKEPRWLGSGPIKGLFDGEHYFTITPEGNGSVKFTHGERFNGILVGFMCKTLDKTEIGFGLMNEAIKK